MKAITLAEVKRHLRIDGTQDDTQIEFLAKVAQQYVETQARISLVEDDFTLNLNQFPSERYIELPRPPLQEVTSIKYINTEGNTETFSSSLYSVDIASKPGRIVLNEGMSWPATANRSNAVKIEFLAGHGLNQLPELLKQTLLLVCGAWFEAREGLTERRTDELPLPFAVTSLLQMHVFPEVAA